MKNFYLYEDRVEIVRENGQKLSIYFDSNTGSIHFRYKINTISGVRHPRICLGYDMNGNYYYMHNHEDHRRPVIETAVDFAKSQQLFLNERQSSYNRLTIVERGLNEIQRSQSYQKLGYNCQVFVNRICFNENRSEAVENWSGGIAVSLLLLFGIKALKF